MESVSVLHLEAGFKPVDLFGDDEIFSAVHRLCFGALCWFSVLFYFFISLH